jgi:hypothetical protein
VLNIRKKEGYVKVKEGKRGGSINRKGAGFGALIPPANVHHLPPGRKQIVRDECGVYPHPRREGVIEKEKVLTSANDNKILF